jgi:ribosome-associated translation inhibitor RaiA
VSETENPRTRILDEALRLGGGFSDADRPWLLDALSGLEPHLSRWDPASITVHVSVKHRDGKEQLVTLRAELPGYPELVARSVEPDLDRALAEARYRLIEQIDDEKRKREPKSNRLLRDKTT